MSYEQEQLHTYTYPNQTHPQQLNGPYTQYAAATNQAEAAPLATPSPLQASQFQPTGSSIPGAAHQISAHPSPRGAVLPSVGNLSYTEAEHHQPRRQPTPGHVPLAVAGNGHQYGSALDGLVQAALLDSPQQPKMDTSVDVSRYDTSSVGQRHDHTSSDDDREQLDGQLRQQSQELEQALIGKISRGVDLFNENNKALQTLERITLENQKLLILLESYSSELPPLAPPADPQEVSQEKREIYEVLLSELVQQ